MKGDGDSEVSLDKEVKDDGHLLDENRCDTDSSVTLRKCKHKHRHKNKCEKLEGQCRTLEDCDSSSSSSSNDNDSDSSTSSDEDDESEMDRISKELEKKRNHPDRLHPELWFNDPGEVSVIFDLVEVLCHGCISYSKSIMQKEHQTQNINIFFYMLTIFS